MDDGMMDPRLRAGPPPRTVRKPQTDAETERRKPSEQDQKTPGITKRAKIVFAK